jgi:hypothetical protein
MSIDKISDRREDFIFVFGIDMNIADEEHLAFGF